MAAPSLPLVVTLALLIADATIELGFITSTVSYLHSGPPSGTFLINKPANASVSATSSITADTTTYRIAGTPQHFLLNQGHASNGAAGTALILLGLGGVLALGLRAWGDAGRSSSWIHLPYRIWLLLQGPALVLTLVALSLVFGFAHVHDHQTIDEAVANELSVVAAAGTVVPNYPLDAWTPQNWFAAVLGQLDVADPGLHADLVWHLRIMRGWQYNLVALFVVQFAETATAVADALRWRRIVRVRKADTAVFVL